MNTIQATNLVRTIIFLAKQRRMVGHGEDALALDFIAETVAQEYPALQKYLLPGYSESDDLVKYFGGGMSDIKATPSDELQVTVQGGGRYHTFHFSKQSEHDFVYFHSTSGSV
jgi:hypothetical protein